MGHMVDRAAASIDSDLKLVCNARLVQIDPLLGVDRYCVLQVLSSPKKKEFYCFQRSGDTGTEGEKHSDGPHSRAVAEERFRSLFKERTGREWGSMKPGDAAVPGMMWLQQQSSGAETARWEYYINDGVDGKVLGWYPYTKEASAEVEDIFAQHGANKSGARTSTRIVKSGYFSYSINFDAFTQTNRKTNKMRPIRRIVDSPEAGKVISESSMKRPMRPRKTKKKTLVMKAVLKKKNVMKKKKKTMKKKAMRVSKIAHGRYMYSQVFSGAKEKTPGGLKKTDIMLNKRGKVVSKRKSARGKVSYRNISAWHKAFMQARKVLGIDGFQPVKKGTEFYIKTREFYDADPNKVKPLRKSSTKNLDKVSKDVAPPRRAASKSLEEQKQGIKRKASQLS